MDCPKCGSHSFVRLGFVNYKTGKRQRYRCKDCRYNYTRATPRKPLGKPCPKCGKDAYLGGHTAAGTQRYFCRPCKFSFSDNTLGGVIRG